MEEEDGEIGERKNGQNKNVKDLKKVKCKGVMGKREGEREEKKGEMQKK